VLLPSRRLWKDVQQIWRVRAIWRGGTSINFSGGHHGDLERRPIARKNAARIAGSMETSISTMDLMEPDVSLSLSRAAQTWGVQMVRDLRGVIEREQSEMGILVTLADPTAPMLSEASAAGFVSKSAHGRLPRLQVAAIEEILDGRLPEMPPLPQPMQRPHKVRRRDADQPELLLPTEGSGIKPAKGEYIDPRFMGIG
jgi:hypothetical protein